MFERGPVRGVGEVSDLSYAYLIASALVAVSASSLALVSSVPLARADLDARGGSSAVSSGVHERLVHDVRDVVPQGLGIAHLELADDDTFVDRRWGRRTSTRVV